MRNHQSYAQLMLRIAGPFEGGEVAVADAADGRLNPGLGEAFRVLDRQILGGFKRSSQRLIDIS